MEQQKNIVLKNGLKTETIYPTYDADKYGLYDLETERVVLKKPFDELINLGYYFFRNRQKGHTAALLNGAIEMDALVVVQDARQAEHMAGRGVKRENIVMRSVIRDTFFGRGKPLVIDHYAFETLITDLTKALEG